MRMDEKNKLSLTPIDVKNSLFKFYVSRLAESMQLRQ